MGVVHIPWYATVFRGDALEEALVEIAPIATRYGASGYTIYRSKEDTYKFLHAIEFAEKLDFERFWDSEQMCDFRERYMTLYQVPVLYSWHEVVASDSTAVVA